MSNLALERRFGRAGPVWSAVPAVLVVLLLAGAVAACSGKKEMPGYEVADDNTWVLRGDTCVMEFEEPPVRRVINRTDPELCGRSGKHRSPDTVRVIPPPGMRSR